MATLSPTAGRTTVAKNKMSFWESQKQVKLKALEKKAKKSKIKLAELAIFTEQLASMLDAGLPLVTTLEALQEQTDNLVFQIILREVRLDVAAGTSFSEACAKFPKAFPQLFVSMVEAGEVSGGLPEILKRTADYFISTVKLLKRVKGALTYPAVVISLAVVLVAVLLVFVIPVFGELFESFGRKLPGPTQALIDFSKFLAKYIMFIIGGFFIFYVLLGKVIKTPRGRRMKDILLSNMPIVGALLQKIGVSRFSRTFSTMLRSGVPILQGLDIVHDASGSTFIEKTCAHVKKAVSEGGQISDVLREDKYFPSMVGHMARAGEQTGNLDVMLEKVSDFYDVEIENTVAALTSLLEPLLIVGLGIIIGGIVVAMFLPIFNLANVVGGA
ncbi:MAG: type II secretion system F family protein [Puniceicoccaceae bacterium]